MAQEETKFGFSVEEAEAFLQSGEWREMQGAEIHGIMCMASLTDDEQQIANEFDTAHQFFLRAKELYFAQDASFCECSWGMSDDYTIALQHGSTMIRVGSKIFGQRQY